jgi:hypothetical protein
MKAILEFNLPEENNDFHAAINGHKYKSAHWELDQLLRSEMKYKELSEDTYKAKDVDKLYKKTIEDEKERKKMKAALRDIEEYKKFQKNNAGVN